jgi:hypothetical protein
MTRTSWLLVGLTVVLLAQVAAGAGTEGQPNQYISLDLEDVSLEEALGALFQDTPHSFALAPGLEDLRVTITLNEVTFGQALRAILTMHDLRYIRSGDLYHVVRDGASPLHIDRFAYGPIIIYSRVLPGSDRRDVVWRSLRSPEEHVLYATDGLEYPVNVRLGYLPAPDGSSLLVWDSRPQRGGETTSWLTFRLPDGRADELGETPGFPWLSALSPLPYWDRWDDHNRLVLLPGSCFFTPDLSTMWGELPGRETPIPEPSAIRLYGDARERLTAYCEQHYPAETAHLRSALAGLADEMEVGYLGGEDPAASPHLLLTSLGIPSERSLFGRDGWSIFIRHAACSPDGKLIAYADTWRHECLPTPEGRVPMGYGRGARLDIFDVATGRRLWYTRRASIPRRMPEGYRSVGASEQQWTLPHFADLRWSRDGRYLSFTTCENLYNALGPSCSVTVVDVEQWRPALYLPNGSNAFVVTPPAVGDSSEQEIQR